MKMTAMSRRGFSACHSEWLLAATAHNLRKLHAHHRSAQQPDPADGPQSPWRTGYRLVRTLEPCLPRLVQQAETSITAARGLVS
jgi:hypothetical protein